jgi:predicted membrane-bound spermidine synthase
MPNEMKVPAQVLPGWMLLATIFISGNVVMMLEVVGTRVVGPFFGVGLYVWSALITVTLLSLAGGYWVGGRLADARRDPAPLYLVILAAAALTFLIPPLRNPVLTAAGGLGFRAGALAGSAALFGPALFLLGMVTPYATKLYTDRLEKLGSRVGLLYSISTLGSFLGTLAMGFYLIPTFRLTTILLGLGFTLLLLPLAFFLLLRRRRAAAFAALLILGIAALVLYPRSPEAGVAAGGFKVLYKSTSFYGELKVIEGGNNRILLLDGVSQSGETNTPGAPYPPYVQDLGDLLAHYAPQAKRVLVIGLGGGNIIHVFLKQGRQVDVVEIDPQVVTAAERYFGVDPKQVKITLEDGRRYVRASPDRYDALVMNAFIGENSPSHLLAKEFFQEAKRILNPGGVVLVNFVGYVQGPHRWGGGAVYATLRASFGWCRSFFRDARDRFGNILYVAGDGAEADPAAADAAWAEVKDTEVEIHGWETAAVCTDEYNPIDFLNRVVYRRWRQLIIDNLGADVLLD